jgi:hypothetical protein
MKKSSIDSIIFTARLLMFAMFVPAMGIAMAGQQPANENGDGVSSSSSPTAPSPAGSLTRVEKPVSEREALTFKDRFTDYRQSTFSPMAPLFPAVSAGYNQLRNYPPEWKQGGEGYGKRLASAYGSLVVGNTISFGIAALDREDPRYVRSTYPKKAIFRRAGYAFAHTFVSPLQNGGQTFAWSRVAGDYGAGFIANTWYPERHSSLHNAVYLGTFNLATDVGYSLLKEFIRPHFIFGPVKDKKTKP